MEFKLWLEDILDDMFADVKANIKKRGKPVHSQRKSDSYVMELYRGFDANLDSLEMSGDKFVLSPKRSEQGMLWFTHQFVRGYDPVDYVTGRGEWLLKYPLRTTKHYDQVTYEDGSVETKSPDEVVDKVDPTKNSQLSCFGTYCLELPSGWFWTYKTEKFIGTTNKVYVSSNMIVKNN